MPRRLKVDIEGSEGLKMAFLAKGEGFDRATLNVYDEAQDDNTTPYAYRWLPDGRWTPVLYRLDRFRYNSRRTGFVRPDARYSELRFYGPEPKGRPVALTLDNFVIYRGEDRSPPGVVSGLRAKATEQGVFLHWAPAPDNVAPMLYVVSRAGSDGTFRKIAETFETRFLDTSAPRGPVRYRVLACDFQNNLGPWSEPVAVVSVSEGRARSLTPVERDRLAYAEQVRAVHERGKGSVRRGHVCLYGDSLTGPTVYRQMVEGALGIYTVGAKGFAGMRTGWGRKNALKHQRCAGETPCPGDLPEVGGRPGGHRAAGGSPGHGGRAGDDPAQGVRRSGVPAGSGVQPDAGGPSPGTRGAGGLRIRRDPVLGRPEAVHIQGRRPLDRGGHGGCRPGMGADHAPDRVRAAGPPVKRTDVGPRHNSSGVEQLGSSFLKNLSTLWLVFLAAASLRLAIGTALWDQPLRIVDEQHYHQLARGIAGPPPCARPCTRPFWPVFFAWGWGTPRFGRSRRPLRW